MIESVDVGTYLISTVGMAILGIFGVLFVRHQYQKTLSDSQRNKGDL